MVDQKLSSQFDQQLSLGSSTDIVNGLESVKGKIEQGDAPGSSSTPALESRSNGIAIAEKPQSNGLSYSYPPPPGLQDQDSTAESASSSSSLPYPPLTPHLTSAPLQILTKDPALGRGVFASQDIPAGQIVEISPVLVLSEKEYRGFDPKSENEGGDLKGVEASQLRGYVFTWGKNGDMAVALGLGTSLVSLSADSLLFQNAESRGLARAGSLFNHSALPNVSYEIKQSEYTIHYRAAKPIKAGEELFIFYGHSVRFSGDPNPVEDNEELVDDGWGGLGGLEEDAEGNEGTVSPRTAGFRKLTEAQLKERDMEVVGFDEPNFPFKKITEIIDPEDAELTTSEFTSLAFVFTESETDISFADLVPCYAIDIPARHSGIVFQFVRKHTSRKFNELQHLKRVRPIQTAPAEQSSPLPLPVPIVSNDKLTAGDPQTTSTEGESSRKGTLAADTPVSILLFPVATAPPDLYDLLSSSPLTQALSPDPIPPLYTVDVPAQAAHSEKQAEEWNKVWPVTLVHIREGPKATMKKKGWERAKMEWIEREIGKVWEKSKQAGERGEVSTNFRSFRSFYRQILT